jgi:hypothetical protein
MLDLTKTLFDQRVLIKKIDDIHSLVTIRGIPVFYREKTEMFNATRLCEEVSSTMKIEKWFSGQECAAYEERFPGFWTTQRKTSKQTDEIDGRYLSRRLFLRILSWANDQAAFDLENCIPYEHIRDNRGYIYVVKPQKFASDKTNKTHKAGRTWRIKQRMQAYGRGTIVLRERKVLDMIDSEKELLNLLDADCKKFVKNKEGDEYYDCERDDILKVFDDTIIELKEQDDHTPYVTLLSKDPTDRLATSGRFLKI